MGVAIPPCGRVNPQGWHILVGDRVCVLSSISAGPDKSRPALSLDCKFCQPFAMEVTRTHINYCGRSQDKWSRIPGYSSTFESSFCITSTTIAYTIPGIGHRAPNSLASLRSRTSGSGHHDFREGDVVAGQGYSCFETTCQATR